MTDSSDRDQGSDSSERRFLTIVFVDLIGYTSLSERLDPEDLGLLQRRYQSLALQTMERYGGFVARYVGDGILAYFGYPRAHEHDAERAIRAALELLENLRGLDTDVSDHRIPVLDARVGIHSGLVLMTQEMISAGTSVPGIVGEAANLAARLQAEAPPGGILISQQTLELVEGVFQCEALGARTVRGLSRDVYVHRVLGVLAQAVDRSASYLRGATRMVGRDQSVERLLDRFSTARERSCLQTVAVVAEAGLGKTRLVIEVCARPELAGMTLLKAGCHEIFASTPLYGIVNVFWNRAGLALDDAPDAKRQKLSRLLDELGLQDPETAEVAGSLLGLGGGAQSAVAPTPQALRRRQYEFVIAALARLARTGPIVLWIEDAHWLDPSSAELLQDVVAELADVPLLLLLTMRSYPPQPSLPEAGEVVRLQPMDVWSCRQIATSIPGAEVLPQSDIDEAVRAAEGNPLFVEQLVLALLDERVERRQNRRIKGVPLKLAEMLSERLDRLPGGRRIVRAAACIGRSFLPDFLLAVLEDDASHIAKPLDALVAAEILEPKRYGAEIRFDFRHALLQRMAYESMVQGERRTLHGRIVDVLLARNATEPAQPEVMAHHLTEAGRTLEAIGAWLKAGVSASTRSAHVEALDHLRRGIGLLDKVGDADQRRELELKLLVSMIGSIVATQGATSAEQHACSTRGLELCQLGPPTPLVFPFLFAEFTYLNCRGRTGEARNLAEQFLALSERASFHPGKVIGHRMLGMVVLEEGDAPGARTHVEASLALYVPERDAASTHMFGQNTEVHSKALLSLTLFCQGEVDRALEIGVDALRSADVLRHPHSTAITLVYVGGWVFGMCDAADAMHAESRRLIQLSDQHRLAGFRAHGMAFFGWSLCMRGELAQGIAAIEQSIVAYDAISFHLTLAGHLANLADAQRRLGRVTEAVKSSARSLELMQEGNLWLAPELLRVAGLVAAERGPAHRDQALQYLRDAVARAQALAFPVLEHRCLTSLSAFLGSNQPDFEVEARLRALAPMAQLARRVRVALTAPPSDSAASGTGPSR